MPHFYGFATHLSYPILPLSPPTEIQYLSHATLIIYTHRFLITFFLTLLTSNQSVPVCVCAKSGHPWNAVAGPKISRGLKRLCWYNHLQLWWGPSSWKMVADMSSAAEKKETMNYQCSHLRGPNQFLAVALCEKYDVIKSIRSRCWPSHAITVLSHLLDVCGCKSSSRLAQFFCTSIGF